MCARAHTGVVWRWPGTRCRTACVTALHDGVVQACVIAAGRGWGRCVWAVQECEASRALVAVLGEKEKVAPALAMGAVRMGGAGVRGTTCLGGSAACHGTGRRGEKRRLLVMGLVGAASGVVCQSRDWWARRVESSASRATGGRTERSRLLVMGLVGAASGVVCWS